MPFTPAHYKRIIIGLAMILIGFGITSLETAEFGFGFLGLTLGPMIALAGFLFEIYAILYKPKR